MSEGPVLRLLLLRHARSDWSHAGLGDHDRPLNPRGLRDAPRVGRWLREHDLEPAGALVSTARRTTDTARIVMAAASGLDPAPEVPLPRTARRFSHLYGAWTDTILRTIREQGGALSPLLVVGHNPGMGSLASALSGICRPYPTAALLVAAFELAHWKDLNPTTPVTPEHFLRPRDLR